MVERTEPSEQMHLFKETEDQEGLYSGLTCARFKPAVLRVDGGRGRAALYVRGKSWRRFPGRQRLVRHAIRYGVRSDVSCHRTMLIPYLSQILYYLTTNDESMLQPDPNSRVPRQGKVDGPLDTLR